MSLFKCGCPHYPVESKILKLADDYHLNFKFKALFIAADSAIRKDSRVFMYFCEFIVSTQIYVTIDVMWVDQWRVKNLTYYSW